MDGQDEFVKQMEFRKTEILWTLVTLSIPTVLEEVLATLLQYVDTAMVGRLGEQATAAVSVTTTITWLVNSVAGAVGVGVLTMIAQAVGRKDGEMIRRVSRQALLLVVGCAAVTGGLSVVLAPFIPVWMGAGTGIGILFDCQPADAVSKRGHGAGCGFAGDQGYENADVD